MTWKSEDLEKELEFDEEKDNDLAELEEEIEKKHPGLLPKRGRPVKYERSGKALPPKARAPLPPLPDSAKSEEEEEEDMGYSDEEVEDEEIPASRRTGRPPTKLPAAWRSEPAKPEIAVEQEKPKPIPVTPSVPVRRFEPYTMPESFGVVDNTDGTIKYEAISENKLVIMMLADILNRIESLERKI